MKFRMKIFITYNRASKDAVIPLVKDIEQLGHSVWFDSELTGGQSWWDNILYNIRDCDVYVFALTREALDSTACKRELEYAKSLQKSALPVLLATDISMAIVPRYLSNIQGIDYSNSSDKSAVFALLKAINNLPASPKLPEPLPEPPPVPISYLDNIKDKIDSPDLDRRDQLALVNELKNKLTDPENKKEDIYGLLKRLKKRDDLLASVFIEIDHILAEESQQQTQTQQKVYSNPAETKTYAQEPKQTTIPPRPVTQNVPRMPPETSAAKEKKKGWNTGLVIVLAFLSLYPPIGILAGIISFFTGATRQQSFLLLGIAVASMIIGALIYLAGYSSGYYY